MHKYLRTKEVWLNEEIIAMTNNERAARLEALIEYFIRERDAGIDHDVLIDALIRQYVATPIDK